MGVVSITLAISKLSRMVGWRDIGSGAYSVAREKQESERRRMGMGRGSGCAVVWRIGWAGSARAHSGKKGKEGGMQHGGRKRGRGGDGGKDTSRYGEYGR
jgi:hypothetical protein